MAVYLMKDTFASFLSGEQDGGKTRFLDDRHRECFLQTNTVDDEEGNEKIKLDFVCETNYIETLIEFEKRVRREEYTENATVVLEFEDILTIDSCTLEFVKTHLRLLNLPYEISICKVPTYVQRSVSMDMMFVEDMDFDEYFAEYDKNFFIDVEEYHVAFCFIKLRKKDSKRKLDLGDEDRETKRRLDFEEEEEEPEGPYKVEVDDADPNAIDDEKRVVPPMDLYISDYDRTTCDALMKKSTSLLMSGKYMHFFRVNVGTPPMVRMYTFDRDTGDVMKKFIPLTEVVVERNIVTKYRDQNTIMQANRLKELMNAFLHEFDADFDGDSIVGLQEVYELFTCYCMREHGYPLRGVEMHCWFFFAVSDLYSGWIVERGGKHYIRCMYLDVYAARQHCEDKGWTLRSLPYL